MKILFDTTLGVKVFVVEVEVFSKLLLIINERDNFSFWSISETSSEHAFVLILNSSKALYFTFTDLK